MNPRRALRAFVCLCLCLPLAGCSSPQPVANPALKAAPHHAIRGHSEVVWQVAFSPDGLWLATSGYDNTIIVWRLELL